MQPLQIQIESDTTMLVRSLQEQVVQYSWRHTLDRVEIEFLSVFCLLLMAMLVLVYFYMKRRLKKAVQVERRQRIFQEAHFRNQRLYEEMQKQQEEELATLAAQQEQPKDKLSELMESGIYRLFHRARMEDVRVTEEDWGLLQKQIDDVFPNFTSRLYAQVPKLSAIELQISLLIKINVSVTDIAYHVSRTKQAVAVSRARLYKKITGNEGSAEMFDKYIFSM